MKCVLECGRLHAVSAECVSTFLSLLHVFCIMGKCMCIQPNMAQLTSVIFCPWKIENCL